MCLREWHRINMSYFIKVGLSIWMSSPYYPWWFLLEKMSHCPIYLGCRLLRFPDLGPGVEWRAWTSCCAGWFKGRLLLPPLYFKLLWYCSPRTLLALTSFISPSPTAALIGNSWLSLQTLCETNTTGMFPVQSQEISITLKKNLLLPMWTQCFW